MLSSGRLNQAQKALIEQTVLPVIEDTVNEIGPVDPVLAIHALKALKGEYIDIDSVGKLVSCFLWSAIVQVRDIYRHPYPQNSTKVIKIGSEETSFAVLQVPKSAVKSDENGVLTLKNGRTFDKNHYYQRSDHDPKPLEVRERVGLLNLTTLDFYDEKQPVKIDRESVVDCLFALIDPKINALEKFKEQANLHELEPLSDVKTTPSKHEAVLARAEQDACMRDFGESIVPVHHVDHDVYYEEQYSQQLQAMATYLEQMRASAQSMSVPTLLTDTTQAQNPDHADNRITRFFEEFSRSIFNSDGARPIATAPPAPSSRSFWGLFRASPPAEPSVPRQPEQAGEAAAAPSSSSCNLL